MEYTNETSLLTNTTLFYSNLTLFNNQTNYNNNNALTVQDVLYILKLRYIVYGWICLPIAIIGLVLNGFTILVLLHQRMRNFSTNIYLTALSLANIVCLLNYIFLYSFRYIISYQNFQLQTDPKLSTKLNFNLNGFYYENFLSIVLWAWSPIFLIFQLFSIYLTCSVTVDRWIYLLFPFKADRICTKKRTYIVILCIFIFCVLFNLPRWFEVTYSVVYDPTQNLTSYQAKLTPFGQNDLVKSILHYYVYIIHVYGIPFFILLIVNIGIIHKLIITKQRKTLLLGVNKKIVKRTSINSNTVSDNKLSFRKRLELQQQNGCNSEAASNTNDKTTQPLLKSKRSNTISNASAAISAASSSKIDPKITFMVLAVVIAFFICQFPYLIVTILSVKHATKLFHILKLFSDLLATINCSVNFLIYCVFGQKFRQTANEILFERRKGFLSNKSKNIINLPLKKRTPTTRNNQV